MDYTGCGNTLNMMHPRVLQLIMDSLRYWVIEMHVDGFRFDLAAALARELHEVDQLGAFMDIIHQDPVLSQVKLIAEPWDLGEGGYQVGNFPVGWTEWNGRYRDVVRDYWRGEGGLMGQLAHRLTGSSDLYQHSGRRPYASINFITAHDGFTLYDLVSHNEKHNAANGEDNRDGDSHNRSWTVRIHPSPDRSAQEPIRRYGGDISFRGSASAARASGTSSGCIRTAGEISDEDWDHHHARCFGVYLIGEALEEQDERGQWVKDDDFLLLLNGHYEAIRFTLPWKGNSELVLDTALPEGGTVSRAWTSPILCRAVRWCC
jgi:pullulanase/glycogen debranching enzyme